MTVTAACWTPLIVARYAKVSTPVKFDFGTNVKAPLNTPPLDAKVTVPFGFVVTVIAVTGPLVRPRTPGAGTLRVVFFGVA